MSCGAVAWLFWMIVLSGLFGLKYIYRRIWPLKAKRPFGGKAQHPLTQNQTDDSVFEEKRVIRRQKWGDIDYEWQTTEKGQTLCYIGPLETNGDILMSLKRRKIKSYITNDPDLREPKYQVQFDFHALD